MRFLKNKNLIKGGLALVLLGLLFASVPFFQIIHAHSYSNDSSKSVHIKDYDAKCCDYVKIQRHFDGVLQVRPPNFNLSFTDTYCISNYTFSFNVAIQLANKAPPVLPIV